VPGDFSRPLSATVVPYFKITLPKMGASIYARNERCLNNENCLTLTMRRAHPSRVCIFEKLLGDKAEEEGQRNRGAVDG
jgi:hypothetical protein